MKQLLNLILVSFRKEQKQLEVHSPVKLSPEQYRDAVAKLAKQLREL